MAIINRIGEWTREMTAWRRDFHQHPELGFEETRTAGIVAEKLRSWGLDEVHEGVAQTGVIGVLHGQRSVPGPVRAIGLRADMDALPMQEANDFPHRSAHAGKMHGCGHDGHTTMLLGAAKYLAETRDFCGTVIFIFQPAEEGKGGGRLMVEEGVFKRFPMDEVYGLHNWPLLPLGEAAVRPGPMMAAADLFELVFTGKGGHAALPHACIDPVVIAAQFVTLAQGIVSRKVDPLQAAVITIPVIEAGTAFNVIPDSVRLKGTVRSLTPETRDLLEASLGQLAEHLAAAHGATAQFDYMRNYPPTINHAEQTSHCSHVLAKICGQDRLHQDIEPCMGAEDFSFMLEQKPGAYVWLGQGRGTAGDRMVHHPEYDFNDDLLPIGASYWVELARHRLTPEGQEEMAA